MRHLLAFLTMWAVPVWASQTDPDQAAALPPVDVLFIGELHDNPWHHENQAALVEQVAPRAVVFEMLTPEKAAELTFQAVPDEATLAGVLDWNNSGWPDFSMYYPIFRAAEGARIYGAQVPRGAIHKVIKDGDVAAVFGPDAARFGLTEALPEAEQTQREDEQFKAHCNALPEEMLPGMVLGQRLRDAMLARQISRAFEDTGGPVVVITGNGHARNDRGAPRLLPDELSQRSIGQFERLPEQAVPHDLFMVTPGAEREDPCLAFTKN